jgi:hypothetical protein
MNVTAEAAAVTEEEEEEEEERRSTNWYPFTHRGAEALWYVMSTSG